MTSTSIILPTYNEAQNISLLIEELNNHLKNYKYEIIIIDDNSPDKTGEIAKNLQKKHKNIKVIIRKNQMGFASAVKTGINNAKYEYILIMNSDFGHPPKYVPQLIDFIKNNDIVNDIVIASRYTNLTNIKINRFQDILSFFLNIFIRSLLNLKIHDLTCCFIIINKEVLNKIDTKEIFNGYGDLEFKLLYKLKKEKIQINIKEIPFNMEPRKYGKSKTKIKYGINYIIEAFKLRFK